MTVDYLIIGQGICGTFLSYYLMQAGKKVQVIDEGNPFTASKVASGVINPVTGRRIVQTWRIDELLPFALQAYSELGKLLKANLVEECSVLDFHPSLQMQQAFDDRLQQEPQYLHKYEQDWGEYFTYRYGIGEIRPCLLVDLQPLLHKWRQVLQQQNALIEDYFDVAECTVSADNITWKNITAQKIIFCDGVAGSEIPFFKNLPYALNKGEAIIARIPGLPRNFIYKQGLSIVSWKDDLFWIGSSYEWNFSDPLPTPAFKQKVVSQLNFWLKLPFEIVDHIASVRPANVERRPFVGLHPQFPSVGILNGMGTKGCSLAPFFARQLADNLVEEKGIYPDADVKRFEKVLARKMN